MRQAWVLSDYTGRWPTSLWDKTEEVAHLLWTTLWQVLSLPSFYQELPGGLSRANTTQPATGRFLPLGKLTHQGQSPCGRLPSQPPSRGPQ